MWTPATLVANTPSYMCGIVNLRDVVLPMIEFAVRLRLPPITLSSRHAILVAEVGEQAVGLLAEGVSEILTISRHASQPAPDVASARARELVDGILALDGRLISLLNLQAVLPNQVTGQAA